MDNGYENNALEKVTPRYDQFGYLSSLCEAASCWIQRANLSFEPPSTSFGTSVILLTCWLPPDRGTHIHTHTHTHAHVASFFSLEIFQLQLPWGKDGCSPIPAASGDLFSGKSWNKTPSRFAAFNRNLRPGCLETGVCRRVTFGKPSSPGENTKLTVLQPGGGNFWLRFVCVWIIPWDFPLQVEIEGIFTHLKAS